MRAKLRIPVPNAKQRQAMAAQEKYIAYGGARGGGKSWFVRVKAVCMALEYPGIKILIVRRTYPELENNHIRPLREQLLGVAKYNEQKKRIQFPNGSAIKFGYCAAEKDMDQYQGAEFDLIFIDEATQIPEERLVKFIPCLRGVNAMPKHIYYTCNPGGPGHGYIKRLFVDRRFRADEKPEEYAFIQALPTDNAALMQAQPEYIAQLEKLPPKLREAWLDGSWDVYEGQVFEDFVDDPKHYEDRVHTHVIEPFIPPEGWKIVRSYDWGYNKPFSCGWWAVDYDGVIYRILELYGCRKDARTGEDIPNEGIRWPNDTQFAEIARMEKEHPYLRGRKITGVADPSIWNANGGVSVAESAGKHGVYFAPGDNQRIPGWMQCHYRLMFDENGYPMMYVFHTCKAFLRTIPLLQYDEHRPEEVDTEGEDHVADEWRYMCMSRPIKPLHTKPGERIGPDPLEMHKSKAYKATKFRMDYR